MLHKLTKSNRPSSYCQPHQPFPNNLTMKLWYLPDIFIKILLYHIYSNFKKHLTNVLSKLAFPPASCSLSSNLTSY